MNRSCFNPWYAWRCRIESWLCWLPCKMTERWYFDACRYVWIPECTLRYRVGYYFVSGHYGAGRVWDEYKSGKGKA